MKNLKKVLAVMMSMAIFTTFAACSNDSSEDDVKDTTKAAGDTTAVDSGEKKGEITAWAWDPNYNIIALNEAKKIYEAENPGVTVNVVEMAKADLEQKLNSTLISGQKDELPDIVLVEDYNAVKYLEAYPDGFVAYDNVNYDDFASATDFLKVDGKTYGVPFGLATSALFYRSDYFEQAGFTEKDLDNITWDQLIEIGKTVKEKTGHILMTFDPDDASFIRMMMASCGQWYTDEEGNPNIADNKYLAKAIETCKKLQESGATKVSGGWANYIKELNNGEAASVITGCWIVPSILAEPSQSGKWKLAPTPRLDIEGSVNASVLGGSSWFVLNGTGNEELAKDFIGKTFAGSKDLYNTILKENGISSMYAPAFDSPAYQKEIEFFGGQKSNALLGEWTKSVPSVNFGAYTWEADAIVAATLTQVINGANVDTALKDAESQFKLQIQ